MTLSVVILLQRGSSVQQLNGHIGAVISTVLITYLVLTGRG